MMKILKYSKKQIKEVQTMYVQLRTPIIIEEKLHIAREKKESMMKNNYLKENKIEKDVSELDQNTSIQKCNSSGFFAIPD